MSFWGNGCLPGPDEAEYPSHRSVWKKGHAGWQEAVTVSEDWGERASDIKRNEITKPVLPVIRETLLGDKLTGAVGWHLAGSSWAWRRAKG